MSRQFLVGSIAEFGIRIIELKNEKTINGRPESSFHRGI